MNRHSTDTHEACRLARLAAGERCPARRAELEAEALKLSGYVAAPARAWLPTTDNRLPVAAKLVGVVL